MQIFATTGTNVPPGVKHSRGPLLLAVSELLPVVTLPRTYSPKNRLDLLAAGPIHRPLRSRITTSVCSLGKGSPLRSLSSRSRSWLQRPLTSSMYRIRVAFVEEFDLADEEWDSQLASTSTVAVRTEVARIGHRATRDVRRKTEEGGLQFRFRRSRRRPKPDPSLGWGLDVTMLEIPPGSGAESLHLRVLRFRSPFQVRLLREACLA